MHVGMALRHARASTYVVAGNRGLLRTIGLAPRLAGRTGADHWQRDPELFAHAKSLESGSLVLLARPEGLEPSTHSLEGVGFINDINGLVAEEAHCIAHRRTRFGRGATQC